MLLSLPTLIISSLVFIFFQVTINSAKALKVIRLLILGLNIITISETWLHNKITDIEIKIDSFVLYRPDSRIGLIESAECILSTINSIERHNELIILGDFNSKWLDYSSFSDTN